MRALDDADLGQIDAAGGEGLSDFERQLVGRNGDADAADADV